MTRSTSQAARDAMRWPPQEAGVAGDQNVLVLQENGTRR